MDSRWLAIASLLVVVTLSCALYTSSSLEAAKLEKDPVKEWASMKAELRQNKKSMCSFLLVQMSDQEMKLTLNKVVELFEQALDHLTKSTGYTQIIKPFVNAQVISEFDQNGGAFVLEISDARRNLIADYHKAEANGASDEVKAQILEKYFYKACHCKLGTVIAEQSMYDSMLKIETLIKKKLHQ